MLGLLLAQLGAQRVLLKQARGNTLVRRLVPTLLPILRSPLLPLVPPRIFLGAPLPPLDPAFSFRPGATSAEMSATPQA